MFQHDTWNSGTLDTTGPSEPVEEVWSFETDNSLVAQPIVKDGTVFQASTDSRIYAVSAETGEEEWSVGTNQQLSRTPAVANSIVYVPTQTGRLIALSVGTGSGQWVSEPGFDTASDVTVTGNSVLVTDVSESEYGLYSLDTATGETQWTITPDDYHDYVQTPVVAGGTVFYTAEDYRKIIRAYRLSDQTQRWESSVGGSHPSPERGAIYSDYDGGTLFSGTDHEAVSSIDESSGAENWRFTNLGNVERLPTFANDTLYVPTEEPALYALDPSIGTQRWRVDLNGTPTSPVAADGVIYLGTTDNSVYAFDAQSGEQRWRFETGNNVTVPPAVLDGTVYVASTDGTLYALREEGSVSPGDVTGDGAPAQDLDEDGLYEDVNGDGAFTIVDVQALFANLDGDVVQNNVEKFDFNGDGEVDVTDVQALYARLNE